VTEQTTVGGWSAALWAPAAHRLARRVARLEREAADLRATIDFLQSLLPAPRPARPYGSSHARLEASAERVEAQPSLWPDTVGLRRP